jgi:small-conductance mechanosensitive channel
MEEFLDTAFLGNELRDWLVALLVFLIISLALYIFKEIVVSKLHNISRKTKTEADDILIDCIGKMSPLFYFVVSIWGASQFISLPDLVTKVIGWITLAVVLFYITIKIQKLTEYVLNKHVFKKEKEGDIKSTLVIRRFIGQITKILIWTVALLLFLQNLGVQISVLLGGLGIAGLAIGFAIQNILEDIFSFFSIYFDKPFEIGDFIIVGEERGTIESIGIKSTRMRSLQGQELVVSNKELISRQIHNYRKMEERRIVFNFGVTYETDSQKLQKVNKIVKKIFNGIQNARIDRVHFHEFGDFSLNYEVVYFVTTQDYYTYMDTQQKVNLELIKEFEKEGIEFAYPTKRILLEKQK